MSDVMVLDGSRIAAMDDDDDENENEEGRERVAKIQDQRTEQNKYKYNDEDENTKLPGLLNSLPRDDAPTRQDSVSSFTEL